MAKKERKIDMKFLIQNGVFDYNISQQELKEYVLDIMTRYGVNVLLQRMAPSIIDGLIPAKRRALYTLFHDMKSTHDGDFNKVADIAGRTIGKYHPHGIMSVEQTIAKMGQDWNMYPSLLEPEGNFGNILGAPPAAGRYIEAKLSYYAYKCLFEEFDPDILDMIPNYTRREFEPLYLPAKYPNFLISGNSGIGVGFTSDIPKFNLREAFELTIGLIESPQMTKVHLYPDSLRGYDIVNRGDCIKICQDGDGSFLMRGKMEVVRPERGDKYIKITNVTENTNMEKIDDKIVELIKANKIQGVKNITDHSDLTFIDYRLILKPEANEHEIMETIYKSTAMQDTMTMKLNFAEKTKFVSFGLKDAILEWIVQREDIKQRSYAKTLRNLKEREHSLDILTMILEGSNAQRTATIFRDSYNTQEAISRLVDTYNITSYQAGVIARMSNSQLTKESRDRYIRERNEIQKKIVNTESIVRSKDSVMNVIVEELEEGIKLFGKDRSCKIISEKSTAKEITKHTIVVTKKFIKKLSQGIVNPGLVISGDEVVKMLTDVPNDGKVTILDKKGRIYNIPVERLLSNELAAKGTELASAFGVSDEVVFVFWTHPKDNNEDKFLTTFTEKGIIKKSSLVDYANLKTSVSQGALVSPEDNICYASITTPEHKHTLIYMNNGYGTILNLDNINATSRVSKGFNHIKLADNVFIQGICDAHESDIIAILTKKGYGKLCRVDDVDAARKKDDLTRLTSLNEDDEVIFMKPVSRTDTIRVLYEEGYVDVKVEDMDTETRLSKGKKLVPVKRGTSIVKVSII